MIILLVILIIACFLCLYRAWEGPTVPDRMVAIDILGILVVGICAILGYILDLHFLVDIALAWIFVGFIGTIALAKYLEGRDLSD
ncbi:MAG: Na(+)/H(+) antiporter subunit F [Phycisphaerales bacterium]|nr:MAG: Na(+)/H(+) antiporter subunit F [Phycisphaerales bacterium]